jgi:hypothetical protein
VPANPILSFDWFLFRSYPDRSVLRISACVLLSTAAKTWQARPNQW